MILKSKINLIRKTLNFISIQWSYLQAFSISWDYPFKEAFYNEKTQINLLVVNMPGMLTIVISVKNLVKRGPATHKKMFSYVETLQSKYFVKNIFKNLS
jgi:hypothetical protein